MLSFQMSTILDSKQFLMTLLYLTNCAYFQNACFFLFILSCNLFQLISLLFQYYICFQLNPKWLTTEVICDISFSRVFKTSSPTHDSENSPFSFAGQLTTSSFASSEQYNSWNSSFIWFNIFFFFFCQLDQWDILAQKKLGKIQISLLC